MVNGDVEGKHKYPGNVLVFERDIYIHIASVCFEGRRGGSYRRICCCLYFLVHYLVSLALKGRGSVLGVHLTPPPVRQLWDKLHNSLLGIFFSTRCFSMTMA